MALERDQWINPVSAFSINERGRQQAAEGLLEKLRDSMRLRGCNEEWTPDPDKLLEGLVSFRSPFSLWIVSPFSSWLSLVEL